MCLYISQMGLQTYCIIKQAYRRPPTLTQLTDFFCFLPIAPVGIQRKTKTKATAFYFRHQKYLYNSNWIAIYIIIQLGFQICLMELEM